MDLSDDSGLWDANFEASILDQGIEPRPMPQGTPSPWRRKLVRDSSWDGLFFLRPSTSSTLSSDHQNESACSKDNSDNNHQQAEIIDHLQQQIKALQEQVIAAHVPLAQLQQKLALTEMERVSLQLQVSSLQATLQDRDKQVMAMRIESMDDLTRNGDRGCGDVIKVPLDEWRELHSARDTAMIKAGEMAMELATCRADADELKEQLGIKNVALNEAKKESQSYKDKLAKVEARLAKFEPADANSGARSWILRRTISTSSSAASVSAISIESSASTASDELDPTVNVVTPMANQSSFLDRLRGGLKTPVKEMPESAAHDTSDSVIPAKVSFVLCTEEGNDIGESDEEEGGEADETVRVVTPASVAA